MKLVKKGMKGRDLTIFVGSILTLIVGVNLLSITMNSSEEMPVNILIGLSILLAGIWGINKSIYKLSDTELFLLFRLSGETEKGRRKEFYLYVAGIICVIGCVVAVLLFIFRLEVGVLSSAMSLLLGCLMPICCISIRYLRRTYLHGKLDNNQ